MELIDGRLIIGTLAGSRRSPWPDYLHALGEVLDLDPEIEINLVDVAGCRPALQETIEREGVEL